MSSADVAAESRTLPFQKGKYLGEQQGNAVLGFEEYVSWGP